MKLHLLRPDDYVLVNKLIWYKVLAYVVLFLAAIELKSFLTHTNQLSYETNRYCNKRSFIQ